MKEAIKYIYGTIGCLAITVVAITLISENTEWYLKLSDLKKSIFCGIIFLIPYMPLRIIFNKDLD